MQRLSVNQSNHSDTELSRAKKLELELLRKGKLHVGQLEVKQQCDRAQSVAITSRMEKERSSKNVGAESDIKGMEKSKIVNDNIQKKSKNQP